MKRSNAAAMQMAEQQAQGVSAMPAIQQPQQPAQQYVQHQTQRPAQQHVQQVAGAGPVVTPPRPAPPPRSMPGGEIQPAGSATGSPVKIKIPEWVMELKDDIKLTTTTLLFHHIGLTIF